MALTRLHRRMLKGATQTCAHALMLKTCAGLLSLSLCVELECGCVMWKECGDVTFADSMRRLYALGFWMPKPLHTQSLVFLCVHSLCSIIQNSCIGLSVCMPCFCTSHQLQIRHFCINSSSPSPSNLLGSSHGTSFINISTQNSSKNLKITRKQFKHKKWGTNNILRQ